jgi:hypothetical protein
MPKSNREHKREKYKNKFDASGIYTSRHVRQKEAMFANSAKQIAVVNKTDKDGDIRIPYK